MLRASSNPDLFHGHKKKDNFFEGWYFKIVDKSKQNVYCFIPGIFLAESKGSSHCFIQFLDGNSSNFKYVRFPKDNFYAHASNFLIEIAENKFSLDALSINLRREGLHISGNLIFTNTVKWPDSVLNPGSMGFYNYLWFMQCYSQVCSMSSDIIGYLEIDDRIIDFTGGKAYIEKNWGKAFPYAYIWVQCNTFDASQGALSCSIGHIPFPLGSFTGFLIGFHSEGEFYKFTTINRSKICINIEYESITVNTWNSTHSLSFDVHFEDSP